MIQPAGLTPTRQWYLYNEIRQYCTDSTKDLVCPLPTVSRTRDEDHDDDEEEEEDDNDGEDEDSEEEDEEEDHVTPKRRCGVCQVSPLYYCTQ